MTQPVLECNNPWETECLCGNRYAPCWPRPDTSCCDRLEPENPTPEQTARIERMLHVATEIIWRLSGKQFGGCPVTVRPCRQKCAESPTYGYWSGSTWTPILYAGTWFNEKCGKCGPSGCSCTELCEIDLPGPVAEILSVRQDGLVLDPLEYRLDNGRKLVRTSFGPLILDQWTDLGGGAAVASESDIPAHSVQIGGGVVVNPDGTLTLPASAGFYALNMGLPNRVRQRIRLRLQPWAELTLPVGWTVEDIQPLGSSSSVFQFSPTEVRGGQFGGWVLITGAGQTPILTLPDGPNNIGEERGGAVLEYVSYIDDNRPGTCWPTCQDLTLPDTEPGTLSVRFRPGAAVPQGGLWAAGLLACQLLKACDEDAECALPANAQRIARQGVTVELTPVLIDRQAGGFLTGIPEVDLWLESVNPYKSKMPSRVYSVDRPRTRVTTWPCD